MAKSKYLSRKLLDHTLGVAAFASPGVYLALFSSVVGLGDGSLANEIAGGSYARQAVSFAAAEVDGSGGKSLSAAAVEFPVATGNWGPMVGWAIVDAPAGGNVLHFGELPKYGDPADYKHIFPGDSFFVRVGDVEITEE